MTAMPILQKKPRKSKTKHLIETWFAALEDSSNGELSQCTHGDYDGVYWDHGWWVTPTMWSLSLSLDWERWRDQVRITLGVSLGPFTWSFNLYPMGAIR